VHRGGLGWGLAAPKPWPFGCRTVLFTCGALNGFQPGVTMYRRGVNKQKSASKFKKHMGKTKIVYMKAAPMRGGIRL